MNVRVVIYVPTGRTIGRGSLRRERPISIKRKVHEDEEGRPYVLYNQKRRYICPAGIYNDHYEECNANEAFYFD